MVKNCPECGSKTEERVKFCPKCGHALTKTTVKKADKPTKKEENKPWSKETRIVCGVLILFFVLGIVGITVVAISLMADAMDEYGHELNMTTEGIPMDQSCINDSDCACNVESIFCQEEFFTWHCKNNRCIAESSR